MQQRLWRAHHAHLPREDDWRATDLPTNDHAGSSTSAVRQVQDQEMERARSEARIQALHEDAARRQTEVSEMVQRLMEKNRRFELMFPAERESSMPPDSEYPLIGLAPTTPRGSDARRETS
ncbi:unnamed protein product [Symbiodinium sp. KB8]|nr:unnamed protein product [Symbiodinium sp. KB8]